MSGETNGSAEGASGGEPPQGGPGGERSRRAFGRLGESPPPARVLPDDEPPASAGGREAEWVGDHDHASRDTTPAVGVPGQPGAWQREDADADVALTRGGWADAQWSYLFGADTNYAGTEPAPGQVADANRRGRRGEMPDPQGPVMKPPVWTWEVPLYFWFGGMAAGSSFVALACDLAGDPRSAAVARKVALAAVIPSPPLLVMDLGRPERFLNMMRIFKPRSPMSMGAWCLVGFSGLASGAVAADVLGAPKVARALGGVNAVMGGYLGSYTGVLLAATAVPLWARSRLFLGPIFVSTATATGASACRIALVAGGLPVGHPTREALGMVETGAMVSELGLSVINERRLGHLGEALEHGRPGVLFRYAKWATRAGLALRFGRKQLGTPAHHVATGLYLSAALAFRYAWVEAGKASARDDVAVARTARGRATVDDAARGGQATTRRAPSSWGDPGAGGGALARSWAEAVRQVSLFAERTTGGRLRTLIHGGHGVEGTKSEGSTR